MKRIYALFLGSILTLQAYSQLIDLSFTAIVNQSDIMLGSILIKNRIRGCDTLLLYPDTVLSLMISGINPHGSVQSALSLSMNYPNPFTDATSFSVSLREKDELHLIIHNLLVERVADLQATLGRGKHTFTFYPVKDNWCILTAISSMGSKSLKMSCLGSGSSVPEIVRIETTSYKSTGEAAAGNAGFEFKKGDTL